MPSSYCRAYIRRAQKKVWHFHITRPFVLYSKAIELCVLGATYSQVLCITSRKICVLCSCDTSTVSAWFHFAAIIYKLPEFGAAAIEWGRQLYAKSRGLGRVKLGIYSRRQRGLHVHRKFSIKHGSSDTDSPSGLDKSRRSFSLLLSRRCIRGHRDFIISNPAFPISI